MLSGKTISMLDALGIALSSMLVVFVVLLVLFIAVKLFPIIFKEKPVTAAVPVAEASAAENDDELLAVITAAVQSYEQEQNNTQISLARNYMR